MLRHRWRYWWPLCSGVLPSILPSELSLFLFTSTSYVPLLALPMMSQQLSVVVCFFTSSREMSFLTSSPLMMLIIKGTCAGGFRSRQYYKYKQEAEAAGVVGGGLVENGRRVVVALLVDDRNVPTLLLSVGCFAGSLEATGRCTLLRHVTMGIIIHVQPVDGIC